MTTAGPSSTQKAPATSAGALSLLPEMDSNHQPVGIKPVGINPVGIKPLADDELETVPEYVVVGSIVVLADHRAAAVA